MSSQEQARAFLNNSSGEIKSWTEIFMELGMPGATYDIFVSELSKTITQTTPQWTSEKPTEPGWYWWRDESCIEVVEIIETVDGLREEIGAGFLNPLTDHGQWAGPLSPPEETAT